MEAVVHPSEAIFVLLVENIWPVAVGKFAGLALGPRCLDRIRGQARLDPILWKGAPGQDGMAFLRGSGDTINRTRSVLKAGEIAPNLPGLYAREKPQKTDA